MKRESPGESSRRYTRDPSLGTRCLIVLTISMMVSCTGAGVNRPSSATLATPTVNYLLEREFHLAESAPTAPLFSSDDRYLLLADQALPRLLIVDLEKLELQSQKLGFAASVSALSADGRFLFVGGNREMAGTALGRIEIDTWEALSGELPSLQRVTDLQVTAAGDSLFLGDSTCNCLYEIRVGEYFGASGVSSLERSSPRRFYLENGPAAEIELLGEGERLLVVHQEAFISQGMPTVGRLGAEMSLIDAEKGSLVDWYWSQRGLGTGSIVVGNLASAGAPVQVVVAVEEDPERSVVVYRVERGDLRLSSKARTIARWSPSRKFLAGRTRLSGSPDLGSLVVFTQGERDLGLLRLDASDDGELSVTLQWSLQVPGRVDAVAVSRDGSRLATTGEGVIRIYRLGSR